MRARRPATAAERRVHLANFALVAAFVLAVYVVVVVGGGALLGHTAAPSLPLSVLATTVVALALEPVRRAAAAATSRTFAHSAMSPYDVLSRFSETVTGGYDTAELPGRMARLLAEGTSAEWAQVWLTVQGRLVLAAAWPPHVQTPASPPEPAAGARDIGGSGQRALTVRHGGQIYGVFRLQESNGVALSAVEERLFAGLAAQAGLVLRLAGLRADLAARRGDLAVRATDLQQSRERLIAAQDDERRRLERDIHDGAQQHLVALAVNLRLVETVAAKDPQRAGRIVGAQSAAARDAIETLSRLARGMYPRDLAEDGLAPALRAAIAGAPIPVTVVDELEQRPPEAVEAALYFVAMEAIQNAAKHASASCITVRVAGDGASTSVAVCDDGVGMRPDATSAAGGAGGAGLFNMRDRIDAVAGSVTFSSTPGQGTCVTAIVPLLAAPVGA